jgi:protein-S-isoprenylcysteine O-methyltransferase Ste14
MFTMLRHLLAILLLPVMVVVVVPLVISQRAGISLGLSSGAGEVAIQACGAVLLAIGLALFAASLTHFATRGKGTLAPWDPPKVLVISGPYRYVRNPMISGVIFLLFGEALVLRSWPHTLWALIVLTINLIYIPLVEEPMLLERFGPSYDDYRRRVWMFLPRRQP